SYLATTRAVFTRPALTTRARLVLEALGTPEGGVWRAFEARDGQTRRAIQDLTRQMIRLRKIPADETDERRKERTAELSRLEAAYDALLKERSRLFGEAAKRFLRSSEKNRQRLKARIAAEVEALKQLRAKIAVARRQKSKLPE